MISSSLISLSCLLQYNMICNSLGICKLQSAFLTPCGVSDTRVKSGGRVVHAIPHRPAFTYLCEACYKILIFCFSAYNKIRRVLRYNITVLNMNVEGYYT